jgi:GNAT superfamily N-acetyltransferase
LTAIEIRKVECRDAEVVARLSAELGYPADIATMEERIRRYAALPDRIAFVACVDGAVVGWIDAGVVYRLQSESYGEIGGLVVSSACRSSGIGAQLVRCAEKWVADRGLHKVVVRSQLMREGAHRFYLRHGYERTKTSAVFSKFVPTK